MTSLYFDPPNKTTCRKTGLFIWYYLTMNTEIGNELLRRQTVDQEMRFKIIETGDASLWDDAIDRENTEFLERIIEEKGWPTISMVGEDASQAAWLLIQHADHKPELQARCLELLKSLPADEIRQANVAYLEDRVRVSQDRPQLYGTQFKRIDGNLEPYSIEDIDTLDERRALMGLETFEANKQRLIDQHKQKQ